MGYNWSCRGEQVIECRSHDHALLQVGLITLSAAEDASIQAGHGNGLQAEHDHCN